MAKKTCGIFLVCEDKLLIGRVTNSDNKWSIPKGLMDKGETEIEAALRELKEETDIDHHHVVLTSTDYFEYLYKSKKKTLVAFLATTNKHHDAICYSMVETDGKPSFPEIDLFKWASFDEALEIIHDTQKEALKFFIEENMI
jgi:8-oxo-dGTP pyrophosphatase MutT (NUDIX family)